MNVGATGKYYKVQSNGKAQAGLSIGDRVVTNSGTYQILDVNADGSYKSALYDENMTTKNYTGKYANGYNPYSNATSLSDETVSYTHLLFTEYLKCTDAQIRKMKE